MSETIKVELQGTTTATSKRAALFTAIRAGSQALTFKAYSDYINRVLAGEKKIAPEEIAVRFHHRLVQIHPFPNGNGRHARLIADLSLAGHKRAGRNA